MVEVDATHVQGASTPNDRQNVYAWQTPEEEDLEKHQKKTKKIPQFDSHQLGQANKKVLEQSPSKKGRKE